MTPYRHDPLEAGAPVCGGPRKWRLILVLHIAFLFLLASSAEGFLHHHHHSAAEDSDCAYCAFHAAATQSDHAVTLPQTVPFLPLVFSLACLFPVLYFTGVLSHSGLSPPRPS